MLEINRQVMVSNNSSILCSVLGTLLNVCTTAHIMSTCLPQNNPTMFSIFI